MKPTVVVIVLGLVAGAACSSKSNGTGADATMVVLPDAATEGEDGATDVATTDVADVATTDGGDVAMSDVADVAMSDVADVATTDVFDATEGGGAVSPICAMGIDLAAPCDGLCSALDANCSDAANLQFTDFDTCIAACNAPTWSCGAPSDQTGNTVFCRLNHATAAGTSADPAGECRNGGPNSSTCR